MNKPHLIILLSLFLIVSCNTTGIKVAGVDVGALVNQGVTVYESQTFDDTKERQLGENLASVLVSVAPIHSDIKINRYVNKVGQHLARHSNRPSLNWQFAVLDSDDINAFAAPGGFVFITSGALLQLDSEAELAAMLAHEVIHITQRHHVEKIKELSLQNALTEAAFISAEAYQTHSGADMTSRNLSQWARALSSMATELYSKGLDRNDEMEADAEAVTLLNKAGYDIYAMASVMQKIDAISPSDSALANLYSTHPKPAERLSKIALALENEQDNGGQNLQVRFQKTIFK